MLSGLSHIGLAVEDIENAIDAMIEIFDVPRPKIEDKPEKQIKMAFLEIQGVKLEILEGYGKSGLIADYVKEKGNGIHHFCFLSDDIEKDMQKLQQKGVEFLSQKPEIGLRGKKIAFSTQEALEGIHFELSEP